MLSRCLDHKFFIAIGDAMQKFAEIRTMRAISEGLMNLVPIVFIGSLCVAFFNLPIPAFQNFFNDLTAGNWSIFRQMIGLGIEDVVALAAMVSVSLSIAELSSAVQNREINIFVPLFTAMACYVIFFIWHPDNYLPSTEIPSPGVLFTNTGGRAILSGLFMAVVATNLFIAFNKLWHKLRATHRRIVDSNYQLRVAMHSFFPMIMTILVFVIARFFVDWISNSTQFWESLYGFMAHAINDGGFGGVLLSELLTQVLWFIGVHGSDSMQLFLASDYTSYFGIIPATSGIVGTSTSLHDMFASDDFYNNFVVEHGETPILHN